MPRSHTAFTSASCPEPFLLLPPCKSTYRFLPPYSQAAGYGHKSQHEARKCTEVPGTLGSAHPASWNAEVMAMALLVIGNHEGESHGESAFLE